MEADYLNATIKQFEYYKALGDKTIAQLSEDQLFFKLDGFSNSIAVIVNHLHGNMRSRWTNFLSEDGRRFENTWKATPIFPYNYVRLLESSLIKSFGISVHGECDFSGQPNLRVCGWS